MGSAVKLDISGYCARVTLSHSGCFNAMSRAMWRELKQVFEVLQQNLALRCVVVTGEGSHFCSGGDISEYASFRFAEDSLRNFHEVEVWGGLQAMLDCDLPVIALIDGNCMGAGLEIASCCDIRIASTLARFGAPIGKLGFPMAPREAELVMRAVGEITVREMLLAASVFDAAEMLRRGFVGSVVLPAQLLPDGQTLIDKVCALAPAAARQNKQSFRVLAPVLRAQSATNLVANAYRYADTAEHREGIQAFVDKRPPQFLPAFLPRCA